MLIGVRIDEEKDTEAAKAFFRSLQNSVDGKNSTPIVWYNADLYGDEEMRHILSDVLLNKTQAITFVLVHTAAQQQVVLKNMGFIIVIM